MTGNSLGAWIRKERKAGKMNQTELGELVGASQVDVSTWETGKRLPDEATVTALEELFGSKAPEPEMANPDVATASPLKRAQPTLEELRTKAPKKKAKIKGKTETTDYRHEDETRTNIPPAKIAAEGKVPKVEKARYAYNPHLPPVLRFDPTGQTDRIQDLIAQAGRRPLTEAEQSEIREATSHYDPWLEWAGKREEHERGSFEVDPVALQIHERVAAQAIVRTAMREDVQRDLFADPQQPYQEAVQFYQHDVDWANRLILGDSLQVMSSLARREGLAGKVQMIYMDPPYAANFASNFQPTVGKRLSHDASADKNLIREPEMVKAYRDVWTLGKHSYLSYLRHRLSVARELLHPSGSIFVQINDANSHLARLVLDEVFGHRSFLSQIFFQTTSGFQTKSIATLGDYLLWYARDPELVRVNKLFEEQPLVPGEGNAKWLLFPDRTYRGVSMSEKRGESPVPADAIPYSPGDLQSQGAPSSPQPFEFEGKAYAPLAASHWKANYPDGMWRLAGADRIHVASNSIRYRRLATDFPFKERGNNWTDTLTGSFTEKKQYVVQTNTKVVERCIHLATDAGDLVVDPTCGSGTTALCAEKLGRRWITIDTSRVSLSIARQRILAAQFDHFEIADGSNHPSSGFRLLGCPHIKLQGIARSNHLDSIIPKHELVIKQHLKACNTRLAQVRRRLREELGAKLKEKQKKEGKKSITAADRRRWLLPPDNRDRSAKAKKTATVDLDAPAWYEWEVPFDTDPDWPQDLQDAVIAYRKAWRDKMDEVNECIAANADQEELVDQPEVVKGVLRVSGPFTVEGVRPEELSIGEGGLFDGTPNSFEESAGEEEVAAAQANLRNLSAYLAKMVQLLRADGVTFPNNQHRAFARVDPIFESSDSGGGLIHAEGIWKNEDDGTPNHVGIGFGPQYGPVTALQVEELIRASRRYDELVIAGFSFDAAASAVIQESSHPKLQIHQAYIRPDVNPAMDGLLKETPNSQLFTVFGQPEIKTSQNGDGEWVCELVGVDIYDPLTSQVKSSGASKVAAWFLDQDYDGRCFCITQAFFPDQKAWTKIAKALGTSADPEAFAAFEGTESLPFKAGKYGRIAVKVIDPRGNEVMAIRQLGEGG